jgi:hypothetical protein
MRYALLPGSWHAENSMDVEVKSSHLVRSAQAWISRHLSQIADIFENSSNADDTDIQHGMAPHKCSR